MIHISLMDVLSSNDIEIFSVYDPLQAFKWLQKSAVDLIICDINLTKMNGLEFVRQLRQKNKFMPVLFFTGLTINFEKSILKQLNVTDVINKSNFDVFYFKHRIYQIVFGTDYTYQ